MTVIYSNFGDSDTKVLTEMWKDLDAKVVEVRKDSDYTHLREELIEAISAETDTLLVCGHGSGSGCWCPNFRTSTMDKDLAKYIKAEKFIGIWCHASTFSRTYNVPGFFSSMFISNPGEAYLNGIKNVPGPVITECETAFMQKVNVLLKRNIPLDKWKGALLRSLGEEVNDVDKFNYNGLYYKEKGTR